MKQEGGYISMTALSVDDSSVVRKIIKSALRSLDMNVLEARNYDEAMTTLDENNDLSIVLLDWNMPGKNGFECLQAIKASEKHRNIPVMMVTTENNKQNIMNSLKAGAVHYLVKPFTIEELKKRVLESLGRGDEAN
jgi:two-component system chemotaxis response regulator CheY